MAILFHRRLIAALLEVEEMKVGRMTMEVMTPTEAQVGGTAPVHVWPAWCPS